MECKEDKVCEIKAACIRQEIDNSFTYVINQKTNALSAIKLYVLGITGLLAYAAFTHTQIITITQPTPEISYAIFSVFGIAFTFLIFLIGWAMLSYLSHLLASITKSHKHISGMRFLKSQLFPNGEFEKQSLMPITHKDVPVFYSSQLPIIFSVINFAALLLIYYFLQLSEPKYIAFWFTGAVLSIFAVYYPTACTKFYKQIICAERVCPEKTEFIVRGAIERKLNQIKNDRKYKERIYVLVGLYVILFGTKIAGMFFYYFAYQHIFYVVIAEIVILGIIFMVRYMLEKYRISVQIEQADMVQKGIVI